MLLKEVRFFLNILKHSIDDFDIVTVLYKDLVSKN